MTPMVPMKSSTGIPFSAWMFLKVCSEVRFAGAAAGWAKAAPTKDRLAKHRTAGTAMNRINLGERLIYRVRSLISQDARGTVKAEQRAERRSRVKACGLRGRPIRC